MESYIALHGIPYTLPQCYELQECIALHGKTILELRVTGAYSSSWKTLPQCYELQECIALHGKPHLRATSYRSI